MRVLLFTIAVMISLSGVTFAQEIITKAEYHAALGSAVDAASRRDRRVMTDETFRTGSQVTGMRQIVSEFAADGARKVDVVEDFDGKRTHSNSIAVNGQYFCKNGEKAWKKADKDCAKAGKMMAVPAGEYEYFVEPHPDNYGWKIYTRRAKWTDSGDPVRDAARLKFIEIKFLTDPNGLITEYAETRRGGIEPNGWSSTHVTKYTYEPAGLNISDPTKGN